MIYGEDKTVTITLPHDTAGEITFILDNVKQIKQIENGIISIDLVNLEKILIMSQYSMKVTLIMMKLL